MEFIFILDLNGIQNEDEFHDRPMKAFEFPHYYGRNRDAFRDCITGLVGQVLVRNSDGLPPHLRTAMADYLVMLRDYEIQSAGRFSVLFDPALQNVFPENRNEKT